MMAVVESRKLADLARAVARLSPSHRDPERFHQDKDEIRRELLRLADSSQLAGRR